MIEVVRKVFGNEVVLRFRCIQVEPRNHRLIAGGLDPAVCLVSNEIIAKKTGKSVQITGRPSILGRLHLTGEKASQQVLIPDKAALSLFAETHDGVGGTTRWNVTVAGQDVVPDTLLCKRN